MTRYTVDGAAMSRYLVDRLPLAAAEVFERTEQGIDVLEAPTVTVSEAIWAESEIGNIAGVEVDTTPNAVLRGLVNDGPAGGGGRRARPRGVREPHRPPRPARRAADREPPRPRHRGTRDQRRGVRRRGDRLGLTRLRLPVGQTTALLGHTTGTVLDIGG